MKIYFFEYVYVNVDNYLLVLRYLLFLQLKMDIFNGRLRCSTEDAAQLAALCLQCEYRCFYYISSNSKFINNET